MNPALECEHCHAKLKINSLFTGIAFLVTGLSILLPWTYLGITTQTIIYSIMCLGVFVLVLSFAPLEMIDKDVR